MHVRQQLPCRERLVDRFGHLRVGHHGSGGCHLRDHVRRIRLTRLGQMCLVAGPARAVRDPVTGIGVIGRARPVMNRREVLALPPAHPPLVAVVLLDPGDPQDLHRLDLAQPVRSRGGVDRLQQDEPVPSDLLRPLFTDLFALGEAVVVHARPVALGPLGRDQARQPCRAATASASSAARGVSPTNSILFSVRTAASTCVESVRCRPPAFSRPSPRRRSSTSSSVVCSSPCSMRRERTGPPQRLRTRRPPGRANLPVPGPHFVSGLPIGQPLRVLQHRHQSATPPARQPGRPWQHSLSRVIYGGGEGHLGTVPARAGARALCCLPQLVGRCWFSMYWRTTVSGAPPQDPAK